MAYFTIVTLQDGMWSPQFGDKDRAVVVDELQEYRGFKAKIIKTRGMRQALIDAEIMIMNRLEARKMMGASK